MGRRAAALSNFAERKAYILGLFNNLSIVLSLGGFKSEVQHLIR